MSIKGLLAGVAAAAALIAAPAALAKTVKVGVVMTFSGGAAQFGDLIEKGMMLYLKEHPEAFGGHEVEIIKRDAKTPAGDIAKTVVQELLTREGIDLLTGFVFSPNAMASAPLVTQAQVPMVILNAGTAFITNMSPYVARTSFTMWQSGYPMGAYAYEKIGCKTAAAGYTDYPPGKDSVEAFKMGYEKAGGTLVDVIPMGGPREVPDFTPFFQRIKDLKPGCFYVFVPSGNHAAAVVKTYGNLGMRQAGIQLIGPGDITPDNHLQAMGEAAVGLKVMFHYSSDYDNPANQAFVKAWKAAYGDELLPDFMAVAGWDGMAAIAHAIKVQDGNLTAEGTMKALAGWTFDSPRGPIMIDAETRDIVQDEHVHEIVMEGGRLKVKVIDTIKQVKDPCKELKVGKCGS
jgi:branched-chain amino acid transport system substrate-binding protein